MIKLLSKTDSNIPPGTKRASQVNLLLGLDDATPDRRAWDEAIMEARNAS
jgi:hypothetical protein